MDFTLYLGSLCVQGVIKHKNVDSLLSVWSLGVPSNPFFVGAEKGGRVRTMSLNDTLRNLSPMMDFALKDDTLRGGKSPKTQRKPSNSSMMDTLKGKTSSATNTPSFRRKSKREGSSRKYSTISTFSTALVETTAAMLVTEDDSP